MYFHFHFRFGRGKHGVARAWCAFGGPAQTIGRRRRYRGAISEALEKAADILEDADAMGTGTTVHWNMFSRSYRLFSLSFYKESM